MELDTETILKWAAALVVGGVMVVVIGYIVHYFMNSSSSSTQENKALTTMNNSQADMVLQSQEIIAKANQVLNEAMKRASNIDTGSGLFAGLDKRLSANRTQLIAQQRLEVDALIQQAKQIEQLVNIAKERAEWERNNERSREYSEVLHQVRMREEGLRGIVAEAAAKLGLPADKYGDYQLVLQTMALQAKQLEVENNAAIDKERRLEEIRLKGERDRSRIKTDEEERLTGIRNQGKKSEAKIKLDTEAAEAAAELDFGEKATRPGAYNEIALLTVEIKRLAGVIDSLSAIKEKTGSQEIELEEAQSTLETYRGRKRDLEKGLYKAPNGQKSEGTGKTETRTPRDAR